MEKLYIPDKSIILQNKIIDCLKRNTHTLNDLSKIFNVSKAVIKYNLRRIQLRGIKISKFNISTGGVGGPISYYSIKEL